MSTSTLADRFARASGSAQSEFELALLVAEVIDKELDHSAVRQMFTDLVTPLAANQDGVQALLQWFIDAGFGDPAGTRTSLQHSNLQWVMQHRQGIPIALAVLLIESARRCGLKSYGVNYPGHFLVSIESQLVDPLIMRPVEPAQLPGADLNAQEMLQRATPKMFGLRMLNNVKAHYLDSREWTRALDMIDYQLAIAGPDESLCASLFYERGEFWEQLGAFSAAAQAFQRCADTSTYKELTAKATARAAELARRSETLH